MEPLESGRATGTRRRLVSDSFPQALPWRSLPPIQSAASSAAARAPLRVPTEKCELLGKQYEL